MYYLKPTGARPTQGMLYLLRKDSKELVRKDFDFAKCKDRYIKGAIICQWVAEGMSLNVIETDKDLPSKYEFMSWLKFDTELKVLFETAQIQRLMSLVEDLYDKINANKDELSDEIVEKQTNSLNKLTKYLKEFKMTPRTVVNTRVYVPRILDKWYTTYEHKKEKTDDSHVE